MADNSFDRCQFDPRMQPFRKYTPEAMLAQDGLHVETDERFGGGFDIAYVRRLLVEKGELVKSLRLERAKAKGKPWALAIIPERLLALPERQLEALLLTYWCRLRLAECAESMGVSTATIRGLLVAAKKTLAKVTPPSPSVEKVTEKEAGQEAKREASIPKRGLGEQLCIRLSHEMRKRLQGVAASEQRTEGQLIRRVLDLYLRSFQEARPSESDSFGNI